MEFADFVMEFGQERKITKTLKAMIVISGEVRMYHQRRLNWRKMLQEMEPSGKVKNYYAYEQFSPLAISGDFTHGYSRGRDFGARARQADVERP